MSNVRDLVNGRAHARKIYSTALALATMLVVGAIVILGLWPFRAPKNDVHWLVQENGISFGEHGSVTSSTDLVVSHDGDYSVELRLRPALLAQSGTILSLYDERRQIAPFALCQSLGDLVIETYDAGELTTPQKIDRYVDDVFQQRKALFLTIVVGTEGTQVYTDGRLVRQFAGPSWIGPMEGRLLLGGAPRAPDTWRGDLKELAVFNRELSSTEVSLHYTVGEKGPRAPFSKNDGSVALFFFDEGNGQRVRNLVKSAPDLDIPARFLVLHKEVLERPWNEFRPGIAFWQDAALNALGFFPLGLFLCAYISAVGCGIPRACALTICVGFSLSLSVELLQALLPTRHSGMTDLLTNSLGTILGASSYMSRTVRGVEDEARHKLASCLHSRERGVV